MRESKRSKEFKTFDSLDDLRKAYGLRPINMQTKNKKRLESQREFFESRHLCPLCKQPMKYVEGTNIMVCLNEECEGYNRNVGNEVVNYSAFHMLDDKGAEIATNIFREKRGK